MENFGMLGCTVPLKKLKKLKQQKTFKTIPITSKKPNLIETERWQNFWSRFFADCLNKNNIIRCSRYVSLGAVLAEMFNLTIRDLLKKPVFERGDANWIDVSPTITKQYVNRIHFSTKSNPRQASVKKSEGFVYQKLLDKRKKIKPI